MNISDILGKNIPDCGKSERNKLPKGVMGGSVGFISVPTWVLRGGSGVLAACISGGLSYEEAGKVLCVEPDELKEAIREMLQLGLDYYKRCMEEGTDFKQDFDLNAKDTLATAHQVKEMEDKFHQLMDDAPDFFNGPPDDWHPFQL